MDKSCLSPEVLKRISNYSSPTSLAEKSPKLRTPGPSKNGYDRACSFVSDVRQWQELHRKGTVVCRTVQELNLHELVHVEYPQQLTPLCRALEETVDAMNALIQSMRTTCKQLKALAKLEPGSEPLFNTWSAERLAENVEAIAQMYSDETSVKTLVKENIAHCREPKLMEVYASTWEYLINIRKTDLELFLSEMSTNKFL